MHSCCKKVVKYSKYRYVKYQTLFRAQCTKWNYVILNIWILKHVLRNVTWWQSFTFSSRLVINQSPFNWVNNYHPLWNIRYFYFKRFDILKSPDWLRWPIAIVFVCLQFYNLMQLQGLLLSFFHVVVLNFNAYH